MRNGNIEQILPMVSIIMPAYNAQEYVEQAIRSVIKQTMPEWELLVFDDYSTDDLIYCGDCGDIIPEGEEC